MLARSAIPARPVGGVAIDAQGVLENVQTDALGQLAKLRAEALQKVPDGMNVFTDSRKVSLRRLEAAIEQSTKSGKPLPDDIRFLAGLQQIRYVFVYPEQKDIILVGPGEGWKVDARGNMVGITTGRPVMLLDDLLVALRTAQAAAQGGITCSIDPTPEGIARFEKFMNSKPSIRNRPSAGIAEVMGMQQITVEGVPATSHFAQVLVAADYRMKCLGMNLQAPPKLRPVYATPGGRLFVGDAAELLLLLPFLAAIGRACNSSSRRRLFRFAAKNVTAICVARNTHAG